MKMLLVQNNNVCNLTSHCFQSVPNVQILRLDRNNIAMIGKHSFTNLAELLLLSLSNNPLRSLDGNCFHNITSTEIIVFLWKINLTDKETNTFDDLNLHGIFTTEYYLCCIVSKKTICTASTPWYFQCTDLLPSKGIFVSFVSFSCVVCAFIFVSVTLHAKNKQLARSFCISIIGININDTLVVLYLVTIWGTNVALMGEFAVQEKIWRSSFLCFLSSTLLNVFKMCAVLLLMLLSVSKLMVVAFPITSKFKRTSFLMKWISTAIVFSITYGVLSTVLIVVTNSRMPTGLCLAFVDPTGTLIFVKVLVWFVAISEVLAVFICIILNTILVYKFNTSQEKVKGNVSKQRSSIGLVLQLLLITLSKILCWFPSDIFFILAIFLDSYPLQLVFYMTGAVLPINSYLMSLVFIIFCIKSYVGASK